MRQKCRTATLNFGRMPRGFRMSSRNDARLVDSGKRFHGGPDQIVMESHQPGTPPVGALSGETTGAEWGGHEWSEWTPLNATTIGAFAPDDGLYPNRS